MFERLIFERMETRILVGITMFLGVMLLVGWVAINEGGRMAAFERQFEGRGTERGAALFASNCAPCHGADARGGPRAPGLNNPQLFGHDYFEAVDLQIAALQTERGTLETQRRELGQQIVSPDTTEAQKAELQTQLDEVNASLSSATEGSVVAQINTLEDQRAGLTTQLQTAVGKGYNLEEPSRLDQLGWAGTLDSFVYTTLVHGRPTSIAYWPEAMPAWSQLAQGPLRDDELRDLTAYILNFDKGADWTVEDLLAVNQFAKIPGQAAGTACDGCIGTEVETAVLVENIVALTGDAERGDALYHDQEQSAGGGNLGCATCHAGGTVGPATTGTWTRVQNERLAALPGYTGEQYLAESIVHPSVYVVPTFADAMPRDFGNKLDAQDLADLIAYLKTTG